MNSLTTANYDQLFHENPNSGYGLDFDVTDPKDAEILHYINEICEEDAKNPSKKNAENPKKIRRINPTIEGTPLDYTLPSINNKSFHFVDDDIKWINKIKIVFSGKLNKSSITDVLVPAITSLFTEDPAESEKKLKFLFQFETNCWLISEGSSNREINYLYISFRNNDIYYAEMLKACFISTCLRNILLKKNNCLEVSDKEISNSYIRWPKRKLYSAKKRIELCRFEQMVKLLAPYKSPDENVNHEIIRFAAGLLQNNSSYNDMQKKSTEHSDLKNEIIKEHLY